MIIKCLLLLPRCRQALSQEVYALSHWTGVGRKSNYLGLLILCFLCLILIFIKRSFHLSLFSYIEPPVPSLPTASFFLIGAGVGLVTKSCLALVTPWWGPPNSSVHGISQERILEWIVISFSRGSLFNNGNSLRYKKMFINKKTVTMRQ